MQLTTSSGTLGGIQSNAMLLFPAKFGHLLALPPNELGTLADVSGILMFRTKRKRTKACTASSGFTSIFASELRAISQKAFWMTMKFLLMVNLNLVRNKTKSFTYTINQMTCTMPEFMLSEIQKSIQPDLAFQRSQIPL
jgi:hypothetical protein